MSVRPSTLAAAVLAVLATACIGCWIDAGLRAERMATGLEQTRRLAAELGLADLALFTEARYTRHPAEADLHSAFQDHPLAIEHFPSGSLLVPRHDALAREATALD